MGIAVTGGAVSFDDLEGSPTFKCDIKSGTNTRVGRVPWLDLDALYDECLPPMPSLPGLYPGSLFHYVKSLDIKVAHEQPGREMVTSGNVPYYETALVTIEYGPLDLGSGSGGGSSPNPSDLITRKWSISGEFLTLEGVGLVWDGGDAVKTEGVTFGKIIPMIKHHMDLHRVETVPTAFIRDLIGKVNDGAYEGAADECLLFTGAEVSYRFNNHGQQEYTLQYEFNERIVKQGAAALGWNYFFRPDKAGGAGWEKIKTKVGGERIYPKGDFSDLF